MTDVAPGSRGGSGTSGNYDNGDPFGSSVNSDDSGKQQNGGGYIQNMEESEMFEE